MAACREPRNHRYTPAPGLPELREAIAAKTARDSGSRSPPPRCWSPTAASRRSTTPSPRCDPGDEVLLPAPYWTTYPEAIRLAGGVPVEVLTDEAQGYLVTVEQLEAARTPRTKVLLFVSPSNPTGAVYSPAAGRGDRPLGRRARYLGPHRRDLRAPGVRRRASRRCPCVPGWRTAASWSTASRRRTR